MSDPSIETLDAAIRDCGQVVVNLSGAWGRRTAEQLGQIIEHLTGEEVPVGKPRPDPDWLRAQALVADACVSLCQARGRRLRDGIGLTPRDEAVRHLRAALAALTENP